MKSDNTQRFLLEDASIRGQIAYLKKTYQTIIKQQSYPLFVQKCLGETLIACLLLAETIKFSGKLSIQFQSQDPLSLLLVQCTDKLEMRAVAKFTPDLKEEAYQTAFLEGEMVITLQSDAHTQSYQSRVPLDSPSIAKNLMHYFAQSEQISTFVWITADDKQAAGFLLQDLPDPVIASRRSRRGNPEQLWEYAERMAETLTAEEIFTLPNDTLLTRLYHETAVRVFKPRKVCFRCQCTPARMKNVLRVIGREECEALLSTYKTIEVKCDFCNKTYNFDSIDVAMVFQ